MLKLSKRLETIAEKVPNGSRLADIGSDHALLPTYLAQRNQICFAVAGEVNAGPLEAARKQVNQANLGDVIDVRRGDGLEVITPGEVDVITVAGMGGALIVRILCADASKLEGVNRLILQPNVGEDQVRRWLYDNDWFLSDEDILEEDGKIYEILTAIKTDHVYESNRKLYNDYSLHCGFTLSQARLFAMGPYLLRKPSSVLITKWEEEAAKLDKIREKLSHSLLEASRQKEEELINEIEEIREVLACLPKDKP